MRERLSKQRSETETVVLAVWRRLLKRKRISRRSNFFKLGGDSVLVFMMVEQLRCAGFVVEAHQVFSFPVLADLARTLVHKSHETLSGALPSCISNKREQTDIASLEKFTPAQVERIGQSVLGGIPNIRAIHSLTPAQEDVLLDLTARDSHGDINVVSVVLSVASWRRLEDLIGALQITIDRHEALRTAVLWDCLPTPTQVICRKAVLPAQEVPLERDCNPMDSIRCWLKPERQRLDIGTAPLVRMQAAPHPYNGQWYAWLQFHRMTIDCVTLELLTAEVVAHLEGRSGQIPEPGSYCDYLVETQLYSASLDARAFFRKKFSDVYPMTVSFGALGLDETGMQAVTVAERLSSVVSQAVRSSAQQAGIGVAALFHAAWSLVVAHTSGQGSVVFGSMLDGRLLFNSTRCQTFGPLSHPLPLHLQLDGLSVKDLAKQTRRELMDLLCNEQTSLTVAQRCIGVAEVTSLFNSVLIYRHNYPNAPLQWNSARGVRMLMQAYRRSHPIVLSIVDLGQEFSVTVETDHRFGSHRIAAYFQMAVAILSRELMTSPNTKALTLVSTLRQAHRSTTTEAVGTGTEWENAVKT